MGKEVSDDRGASQALYGVGRSVGVRYFRRAAGGQADGQGGRRAGRSPIHTVLDGGDAGTSSPPKAEKTEQLFRSTIEITDTPAVPAIQSHFCPRLFVRSHGRGNVRLDIRGRSELTRE